MSFDAMSWAVRQDCQTPTAKLVLLLLANYADEHASCYPSKEKLAELANCDERTIRRAIKSLTNDGLLLVAARFENNKQTSNRYVLPLDNLSKRASIGVTKTTPLGVTNMSPNTVRVTQSNINTSEKTKRPNGYTEEFEAWWKTYPRRDGSKANAFKAWQKVTKTVEPQRLLAMTAHYAQIRKGKDQQYTPHATTWLNQARYETLQSEAKPTKTTNRNQLAG